VVTGATQGEVYWSLLRLEVETQLNVDGHDSRRLYCKPRQDAER
jgi:hypothetical protein